MISIFTFTADLILESLKFVEEFEPKVVFFENVPGIAISGPLASLRHKLAEIGYCLGEPKKLNAADYGVPQRRERCIMVAARCMDRVEAFYDSIMPRPNVTVRGTICQESSDGCPAAIEAHSGGWGKSFIIAAGVGTRLPHGEEKRLS